MQIIICGLQSLCISPNMTGPESLRVNEQRTVRPVVPSRLKLLAGNTRIIQRNTHTIRGNATKYTTDLVMGDDDELL